MPNEFFVKFHINGAKRSRTLSFLPRAGDRITLYDAHGVVPDENNPKELRLRVDDFYAAEDERGEWAYWVNCTVIGQT